MQYARLSAPGDGAEYPCRAQGACAPGCTTAFKNAHGTIFRELLYPWHPWFAHRIAVHEAIGKSNDLVFRCTLTGSDAGRSVEIPAWMFDRSVCAAVRLTAAPYVSAAALSALRDLLPPRARPNFIGRTTGKWRKG